MNRLEVGGHNHLFFPFSEDLVMWKSEQCLYFLQFPNYFTIEEHTNELHIFTHMYPLIHKHENIPLTFSSFLPGLGAIHIKYNMVS